MSMLYDVKTLEPEEVEISGLITIGATSSVASYLGAGYVPTKNTTGIWDITFNDAYPVFLGCSDLTLEAASADDKDLQVVSYTAGTKVLQIRCYDISGGAAAHPASGNKIAFTARFKRVQV